jgi:eukaryotic-like serine/threonine-protein kinase
VTVIDAGEDQGHPFIVLEYVEGETLKDRIRRLGRLDVPEAVAYAIEIGRALMAAHQERMVHRDVKPQNVLIDMEGRGKVTDFGIARSLETEGLTATGRVLGTTDYVSPEQALGDDVNEQSDIYSLGIVLYEMLTGDVPFKAETQVAVAMKHVREPMPDVQHMRPEVSAALASVVDRATAKEPRNRYSSVREMLDDLEHVLAIEATRSGHTSGEATTVLRALPGDAANVLPRRLRNPRAVLVATLLAAALAAIVAIVLITRTETDDPNRPDQAPGARALQPVELPENAAADYDPPPGDGREHPDEVARAIDSNRVSAWTTERYQGSGQISNKEGVGLRISTGEPVAARRLDLIANPSGFEAAVYAANSVPQSIEGWERISEPLEVGGRTVRIPLDTNGRRYANYLVWITKVSPEGQAGIAELSLYR